MSAAKLAEDVVPRSESRSLERAVAKSDKPPSLAPAKTDKRPLSTAANLRQAKQRAQAHAALMDGPVPVEPSWDALPPGVAETIRSYRAYRIEANDWARIDSSVRTLLAAYAPPNVKAVTQIGSHLVAFALWTVNLPGREDRSRALALGELLVPGLIDLYISEAGATTPKDTLATARSAIRRAVNGLAPGTEPERLSHRQVRPPYSPKEVQHHRRIALHQPTDTTRQQLCAWVGLGYGAGLGGGDQRGVRPCDVSRLDLGDGTSAMLVAVRGNRSRTVVVRAEFEPLVEMALALHASRGFPEDYPLHGRDPERKNVSSPIKESARTAYGSGVDIDANRMRTTWLLAMMNAPISLAALLRLAGLGSARSLVEILEFCPFPDPKEVAAAARLVGTPPARPPATSPGDGQLPLFEIADLAADLGTAGDGPPRSGGAP